MADICLCFPIGGFDRLQPLAMRAPIEPRTGFLQRWVFT